MNNSAGQLNNFTEPIRAVLRQFESIIGSLLLLSIVAVAIVLLPLLLMVFVACRMALYCLVWLMWCRNGPGVLLVYSRSPHWEEEIEQQLLPRLPETTRILNWSDRSRWKRLSLEVQVFRTFGGSKDFNPLVLVFRPLRPVKDFRFYPAFQARKRGRPEELHQVTDRLLQCLSREQNSNI